jgi:hypothetical protein
MLKLSGTHISRVLNKTSVSEQLQISFVSAVMKNNEWNLLQWDAVMPGEAIREDSLELCLDYEIHRRLGELIARAAQHKTKGYYDTRRWTEVPALNSAELCRRPTNA